MQSNKKLKKTLNNVAIINNKTQSIKLMRRDRTDRVWFSRLLWHPARKQSILTTLQPARSAMGSSNI